MLFRFQRYSYLASRISEKIVIKATTAVKFKKEKNGMNHVVHLFFIIYQKINIRNIILLIDTIRFPLQPYALHKFCKCVNIIRLVII